jgi:hypothetical protein
MGRSFEPECVSDRRIGMRAAGSHYGPPARKYVWFARLLSASPRIRMGRSLEPVRVSGGVLA